MKLSCKHKSEASAASKNPPPQLGPQVVPRMHLWKCCMCACCVHSSWLIVLSLTQEQGGPATRTAKWNRWSLFQEPKSELQPPKPFFRNRKPCLSLSSVLKYTKPFSPDKVSDSELEPGTAPTVPCINCNRTKTKWSYTAKRSTETSLCGEKQNGNAQRANAPIVFSQVSRDSQKILAIWKT